MAVEFDNLIVDNGGVRNRRGYINKSLVRYPNAVTNAEVKLNTIPPAASPETVDQALDYLEKLITSPDKV